MSSDRRRPTMARVGMLRSLWVALGLAAWAGLAARAQEAYRPTEADRSAVSAKLATFRDRLDQARSRLGDGANARDALADVEVCGKGAEWALRFGEFFDDKDRGRMLRALDAGLSRLDRLGEGKAPWADGTGSVVRGFRSKVDGSVQPYAVVVPIGKPGGGSGDDRLRLDVVLHGRDARVQEARFFDAHEGKPPLDGQDGLVLHVFGRGNNAYRWAGEADVFEAIEAVKRNYWVDESRVVLRGFSMGGAGAWHLGLHHPSAWASVEAGAGFTETLRYAKLNDPTDLARRLLRIYDAVDYAPNAFDVPIVAYGGEEDPQAQASRNVVEALEAQGVAFKADGQVSEATTDGYQFARVVGKGMGHKVDEPSARWMADFHARHAGLGAGVKRDPARIKFVTYTLKYPKVGWLKVHRVARHYDRTTLEASTDRDVARVRAENVVVLAVDRSVGETVELDGQEFPLREAAGGLLPDVYFQRSADGLWSVLDHDQSRAVEENAERQKRPDLQGPIDDAFASSFVCVRGTGTPISPKVQAWADARLARFADTWARYMRGDLPIVDDAALTPQDVQSRHLVLFGDPGSNRWIAQALPELPVAWTPDAVKLAGESFPALDHAPALITANPLNPLRYLVINSGHTFTDADFKGSNALLYPRLGDRAVIKVGETPDRDEIKLDGLFDERWK